MVTSTVLPDQPSIVNIKQHFIDQTTFHRSNNISSVTSLKKTRDQIIFGRPFAQMDIWLGGDSLDNVTEFVNFVNSNFSMCSRQSHVQDKTSKQLAVL